MATLPAQKSIPELLPRWLAWEVVFYCALFALALLTRFVNLDAHVMSHDESLQSYLAWGFVRNGTLSYSPLYHGPLTMELAAISFRLFGDSDFTARLFPALMGVSMVMMPKFLFERWLGKIGAKIAGVLVLINPMLLYYSRVNREDTPLIFAVTIMVYAMFAYLDGVRPRRPVMLVLFSAAMMVALAASEFAFTHIVIIASFLLWIWFRRAGNRARLITLLVGVAIAVAILNIPPLHRDNATDITCLISLGLILPLAAVYVAMIFNTGTTWRKQKIAPKENRISFDLLITVITLLLPWLAAIPALIAGYNLFDHPGSSLAAIPLGIFLLIATLIGLTWRPKLWLLCAGVSFVLYILLFLIPAGWNSGVIDSLAYWLPDHGGVRGSQPIYYYFVIQLPLYEFMDVFGLLIAAGWGMWRWWRRTEKRKFPNVGLASFTAFCGFWAFFVLVELTQIGAKMPWLVVNFSVPAIFVTASVIGRLIEQFLQAQSAIIAA